MQKQKQRVMLSTIKKSYMATGALLYNNITKIDIQSYTFIHCQEKRISQKADLCEMIGNYPKENNVKGKNGKIVSTLICGI